MLEFFSTRQPRSELRPLDEKPKWGTASGDGSPSTVKSHTAKEATSFAKRPSAGGWSISMLLMGILLCSVGAILLSLQLRTRAGSSEDCIRTTDAYHIELSSLQEQLGVAKRDVEVSQQDKDALSEELNAASSRLNHLENLQTLLKGEQKKLEDKFKQLQKDKQVMVSNMAANKAETKQVESLAHQLEDMLAKMHVGASGSPSNGINKKPGL
uniref:Uncharacterized protein n=1 Tax=Dunaliella tertiolecta TaxID=3047 RepID=A0A7S3R749_DUNTE|mmetsp:Transcript_26529/g.71757  ORF Transcript_26529/g.71757 Transcript_26529/m.71757 type:complete len:212 (+) Transcript_26529:137-772(+)|eukprot:CAMPEP_0202345388 /NCGR_PEP_ID=MMETSP1126-20121109/4653_1 /ASSEMBLY_ACC=CAM_ASM_000457 /TAXON_ID=3047 /ORGANISM="Dunaliella tertiolecta, Strain CCMP1320" /LENGTH=211 /DNA_ID=CAMNT_0048936695 /DNA_START=136 /DNA_END=771 /DNA_ORIENTATION=+